MTRLAHLDGLRFLAQVWILASDNLYIGWKPNWMKRPDAAVSLFIAMSGFCTHWANAGKMSTSWYHALAVCLPFWIGRFLKTAFLYYLALIICIVMKNPNMKPALFVGGFQRYPVPMSNSEYVLSVIPSLTVLHPWTPFRASNVDDVVNGPSWTVMTLIWIWLAYPLAASATLRHKDANLTLVICLVACLVPYTFVQPWAGKQWYGTAFDMLYEWPPFVLPRFLAGLATAELFRRREASFGSRRTTAAWVPFVPDVLLLAGWALAEFIPFTGGADPGFGHRCARSGYEILFDVALIPLWLAVFYLGGLDHANGHCGPFLWVCRSQPMAYLGKWVWGMYIFREPVHLAVLLAIPPKHRCR
jgi:hypothetical protein